MTSEASPKSTHHPENPASRWDNCTPSDSDTFSDSDGDVSDAENNDISAEWTATVPLGDRGNPQAAVFTEDQEAFFREVLEESCIKRFDSPNSILIACMQAVYRMSLDSQETKWQDIKLLQEQANRDRLAREELSHELEREKLAGEKLTQELRLAQSKLNLVESMRSEVKLLQDGLEKFFHKLQAAQQEIETGKFERAKLSRDLRAAQDEIETAEEELGEKEEQVVTIQNLLVDVETAHIEMEKSMETKNSFLLEKLDSMQANLQSKEGFVTECNKLRSEVSTLQSQVVAMHNVIQSREQKENKRIAAIHCRVENQEQQITSLEQDGRHQFKAYQLLKDFTDTAAGKLTQIDNFRMVIDAHSEGIQSQERTSVRMFKTLQTRIDDHDHKLRWFRKKFPSYATNDSVGRVSNLLANRIDDCTIQIGQNSQWLRDGLDSKVAAMNQELKELAVQFESISAASVPNLHERIDAANAYIDVVDGHVKAVDQKVQLEAHRIIHVGQHIGVVECQIGEIQSQNTELQEDNTKLHCLVEQQGSMLRQMTSQVMPGTRNSMVNSIQTDFFESSSSPVLTESNTAVPFPDRSWTVAEAEQKPNENLFNGRAVKPEGYQDLLHRLPDNIRLIFSLADAAVDPRPTINSLSANHENMWAGIPLEHRRLVALVCLKYMASKTKPDDDLKHLKWIAEILSAEDWAEYEQFVNHQACLARGNLSEFQGETERTVKFPFAFKCYRNANNRSHEPLATTDYMLSKDSIQKLKTWLDANKVGPAAIEIKEAKEEELMGGFEETFHNRFGFEWSQDEERVERDLGNESDSETVVYPPLDGEENLKNKGIKPFEDSKDH